VTKQSGFVIFSAGHTMLIFLQKRLMPEIIPQDCLDSFVGLIIIVAAVSKNVVEDSWTARHTAWRGQQMERL
jgi:hypothetical protein